MYRDDSSESLWPFWLSTWMTSDLTDSKHFLAFKSRIEKNTHDYSPDTFLDSLLHLGVRWRVKTPNSWRRLDFSRRIDRPSKKYVWQQLYTRQSKHVFGVTWAIRWAPSTGSGVSSRIWSAIALALDSCDVRHRWLISCWPCRHLFGRLESFQNLVRFSGEIYTEWIQK